MGNFMTPEKGVSKNFQLPDYYSYDEKPQDVGASVGSDRIPTLKQHFAILAMRFHIPNSIGTIGTLNKKAQNFQTQ